MIFKETGLIGSFIIQPEKREDERGFFARTWCKREFEERGLAAELVQCSISFNQKRGTLRGIHYQAAPNAEDKLVRCTMGAIYDVIIDLRPDSPTFKQHVTAVLTQEERNMLFVPQGCAHGFLTLEDNTEVFYQMSEFYHPSSARGVRWDDPVFEIAWPGEVRVISERDRNYPDFNSNACLDP